MKNRIRVELAHLIDNVNERRTKGNCREKI